MNLPSAEAPDPMEGAQRILIGSAVAVAALAVLIAFSVAFLLAPLFVGIAFVIGLLFLQRRRR